MSAPGQAGRRAGAAILLLAPMLACAGPGEVTLWRSGGNLLAVLTAALICVHGYQALLSVRRDALVFLSLAFGGIGLLHAAAVLATVANASPASLLCEQAAQLLAAAALLTYVWLPPASAPAPHLQRLGLAMTLSALALLTLSDWQAPSPWPLPWLTLLLHGLSLGLLWRQRGRLPRDSANTLLLAVLLAAIGTLSAVAGHPTAAALYQGAASLCLFRMVLRESLGRPLQLLETRQEREKVTLNASPDGIVWVDQRGIMQMANPAMAELSGYDLSELIGQNVAMLLPPAQRDEHARSMGGYFGHPRSRAMGQAALLLQRRDGSQRPIDISLGHWQDGETRHAIAYVRDLSERKAFEHSLHHHATHDDLTGLPNRRMFKLLLNQAVARASRNERRIGLLFLDLDHFKTINDSFGHAVGDALLIEAGVRIRAALRDGDVLARLGGDEFAVMLGDLSSVDEAVTLATKLLQVLKAVYPLQHQQVYSGASIGIAFLPDDAGDADTLLRYADMAMYQAKQSGRGAYACYSRELNTRAHEDMRIHTRLKEALAENRLQLYYQPQVDVASGALLGAEALLRWHDEQLGQVPPSRFVAVAEATGLILPLSDWVLQQACRQIAAWAADGTPLRVAVNFSAHQFSQPNLVEQVEAVLHSSGAPAALLDIEITETVAMTRPDLARAQIESLVALGCSVALDDFGTGYSSLTCLKDLPVSKLKIDRSFVQGLPADSNDCTIAQAIIGLARSFDLALVAEGVENEAQLNFLREQGCEMYQGWWYAKAMPAAELGALLQRGAGQGGGKGGGQSGGRFKALQA